MSARKTLIELGAGFISAAYLPLIDEVGVRILALDAHLTGSLRDLLGTQVLVEIGIVVSHVTLHDHIDGPICEV